MIIVEIDFQNLNVKPAGLRVVQRSRVRLKRPGSPGKERCEARWTPNSRPRFGPIFDTHIDNLNNTVGTGRSVRIRRPNQTGLGHAGPRCDDGRPWGNLRSNPRGACQQGKAKQSSPDWAQASSPSGETQSKVVVHGVGGLDRFSVHDSFDRRTNQGFVTFSRYYSPKASLFYLVFLRHFRQPILYSKSFVRLAFSLRFQTLTLGHFRKRKVNQHGNHD
jgi:hypothetical protein